MLPDTYLVPFSLRLIQRRLHRHTSTLSGGPDCSIHILHAGIVLPPYGVNDLVYRLFENLEERFGVEADPERDDDQGSESQHLAGCQVIQLFVLRVGDGSKEHALVEPKQIRG